MIDARPKYPQVFNRAARPKPIRPRPKMGWRTKAIVVVGSICIALNALATIKGIKPGPVVVAAASIQSPKPATASLGQSVPATRIAPVQADNSAPPRFAIAACAIAIHAGNNLRTECRDQATFDAGATLVRAIEDRLAVQEFRAAANRPLPTTRLPLKMEPPESPFAGLNAPGKSATEVLAAEEAREHASECAQNAVAVAEASDPSLAAAIAMPDCRR